MAKKDEFLKKIYFDLFTLISKYQAKAHAVLGTCDLSSFLCYDANLTFETEKIQKHM